ncbi:MAG: acyl-CoA dehydrogenase family protein [Acidimicrobiales bacterium]|nr:acyl-CoA dehydrogenase family protein [Acidimicrobiales bacterium]
MTITAENTDVDAGAADRFVPLAREVGRRCAETADVHDRDGTFVAESYEAMRSAGYLGLAVPESLGGGGATMRQVCHAQAELARHCGSSALAVAMHLYNTLVLVARLRNGAAGAEATLGRIAAGELVVSTSGGSDWLWPSTVATEVDGGYSVSGRKVFNSQAPAANVMTTSATIGEPGPGAEVIHFSLPMQDDGVSIVETWDTLGMRGTASHDVLLENVHVPAERVVDRRPWGQMGKGLHAAAAHFAPVVAAVYWGIAASARDHAVERLASKTVDGTMPAADDAGVQREVGLMDTRLRVAWWALEGALDDVGEPLQPGPETLETLMVAKRECVLAARDVVDRAMDVAGGGSYFRSSPIERCLRDVRAGSFHPLAPEATLRMVGRHVFGRDGVTGEAR